MRHTTKRTVLSAIAVLSIFAFGSACGEGNNPIGSAQDRVDQGQKSIDDAQKEASEPAEAIGKVPTNQKEAEQLAKDKGTELLTRDADLENNSTCSKSAGDIMKLSKLQEWKDGPYSQDIQYSANETGPFKHGTEAIYEPLNNKDDANPYRDWSFDCGKHPVGYYRVQFISGGTNLGQVSGPVTVIVKE